MYRKALSTRTVTPTSTATTTTRVMTRLYSSTTTPGDDSQKGGRKRRSKFPQHFFNFNPIDTGTSTTTTGGSNYRDVYYQFLTGPTAKPQEAVPKELPPQHNYQNTLHSLLLKTNPRLIKKHLDEFIVGQSNAKEILSCAVYNHYTRVYYNLLKGRETFPSSAIGGLEKSNILLLGPSGSGKTLMAKQIANLLQLPFSMNDATTLTQAGYVGDDVEQCIARLFQNAQYNISKTEIGLVFIDEIDKITKKEAVGTGNGRDVGGEGVQQGLLKMLEGSVVNVPDRYRKGETVQIDTTNILFILSGAFVGLEKVVGERVQGSKKIGFGGVLRDSNSPVDLKQVKEIDLIRYGLIPEFVGRVPLLVPIDRLTEDDLTRILTAPKNSLLSQYKQLFYTWNIDLSFHPDAFRTIAKKVIERETGARGLRSMMEEVLKEAMYIGPGSSLKQVYVDEHLEIHYKHEK